MDRYATFSGSILELNRYLQRIREIEMKPLGLHANHVMALHFLGKNPQGMTMTELTTACHEDKAAVSRCLSQLTERGYVATEPGHSGRHYRTKLYLTESGRKLSEEVAAKIDAAVNGGGAGLTDEQRDCFYSAMSRIVDNLSQYLKDIGK